MAANREKGEMEDLQTDVMRFMAILALCLMAIFALVQGTPLRSFAVEKKENATTKVLRESRPAEQPMDVVSDVSVQKTLSPAVEKIKSTTIEQSKINNISSQRSVSEKIVKDLTSAQYSDSNPESNEKNGFTLRFESDAVLQRLLTEKKVALYAVLGSKAWQLEARGSRLVFKAAPSPRYFNAMVPETIPETVMNALQRDIAVASLAAVSWGVILPLNIRQQIGSRVAESSGGILVIRPDGRVSLDPPD